MLVVDAAVVAATRAASSPEDRANSSSLMFGNVGEGQVSGDVLRVGCSGIENRGCHIA